MDQLFIDPIESGEQGGPHDHLNWMDSTYLIGTLSPIAITVGITLLLSFQMASNSGIEQRFSHEAERNSVHLSP